MRPIKFRAWNKGVAPFVENWEKPCMIYDVQNLYDGSIDGLGAYGSFGSILGDTDRFVVEQFTGVLDKDGREIYEGDIVACKVEENRPKEKEIPRFLGVVEFHEGTYGVGNYVMTFCSNKKVVGNVHQNPGLIGAAR